MNPFEINFKNSSAWNWYSCFRIFPIFTLFLSFFTFSNNGKNTSLNNDCSLFVRLPPLNQRIFWMTLSPSKILIPWDLRIATSIPRAGHDDINERYDSDSDDEYVLDDEHNAFDRKQSRFSFLKKKNIYQNPTWNSLGLVVREINPRKIFRGRHSQNFIHAKINPHKVLSESKPILLIKYIFSKLANHRCRKGTQFLTRN